MKRARIAMLASSLSLSLGGVLAGCVAHPPRAPEPADQGEI